MKRLFTRIALLAIFAGAFMSSCTEDEYSMENGSEIEYSYKTTMSPVNRLNPNDSIGVLHNIHLDSIISLLCDNYADADAIHQDTLNRIVRDYFFNIYDKDIVVEVFDEKTYRVEDNKTIDTILTGAKFSEETKKGIFSLLEIVNTMENTGYEPYYDTICNFEKNIISNSNTISQEEKQILLSFTSVLRHSLYYWYEENPSAKVSEKWQIAVADAKGALTGGLQGVGIGKEVGGTVGASIGAGVGAVIGAVEASIEKAAELDKIKQKEKDKENQEKPKE